ncbi:hypothetical protein K0U07_03070 [bacterium]|nr:hypothetical protein [bacterium]
MSEKDTKHFTKRIYSASNDPSSLLNRTLVPRKNPSEKDAPHWKKLCEILQDLQKLSATKDMEKTEVWIEKTIHELEALLEDAGIEKRGNAMQHIMNTIKGK